MVQLLSYSVTLATNLGLENNFNRFCNFLCFKCINYFNTICDGLYFRKSTKGKGSAFKGIVPVVLVSGLSFLIPEMVVSYFAGARIPGLRLQLSH